MNNNGGGAAAAAATTLFGGLGFGAPKTNEPQKTGFGGFGSHSLFGAAVTTPSNQSPTIGAQAQQQKSPFGNILKTATFNESLFNSFKTPQKTGFAAPATSFRAAPAFETSSN